MQQSVLYTTLPRLWEYRSVNSFGGFEGADAGGPSNCPSDAGSLSLERLHLPGLEYSSDSCTFQTGSRNVLLPPINHSISIPSNPFGESAHLLTPAEYRLTGSTTTGTPESGHAAKRNSLWVLDIGLSNHNSRQTSADGSFPRTHIFLVGLLTLAA